jgi:glycosidase
MTFKRKPNMRVMAASIALLGAGMAAAAPDTAVTNKQNFTTDVVYQIVTDRFVDGDMGNNPGGAMFSADCASGTKLYCGGDWAGITQKINENYFTDLGITALWISPPVENIDAVVTYSDGKPVSSSHGYWGRDFKRTNPYFGHFTDFTTMINAAHAKGIKVIIDYVPNHTSPADVEVTSFAENGRLYDDGVLLASYTGDLGNTYRYFHHNGYIDGSKGEWDILETTQYKMMYDLADLDQTSGAVDRYLKESIKKWLDLGVDGIRVDAIKHMSLGSQKNLFAHIYAYKPVYIFGEWMMSSPAPDPASTEYADKSGGNLLNFRYARILRDVLRSGTASWTDFNNVINATASDYKRLIDQAVFMDNHDVDRFQTATNTQRNLEQALALTLTVPGVPVIYYGTEQYMQGDYDSNAARDRMTSFDKSTLAYLVTKDLSTLRKNNPALPYGSMQQRWINDDVYIFERKFGNNVVMVAVNRHQGTPVSISGLLTALPNGTYTDVLGGKLNGNTIGVSAGAVPTFNLGAGAVAVWQYKASGNAANIGHVGPMMGKPGNTITIGGRGFGGTKGTVYFGSTAVTGASILSWEDSNITVKVPAVAAGKYGVKIATSTAAQSNVYPDYTVLTGDQVLVRFVVKNATTDFGENVYLSGNVDELGNWDPNKAIGPLNNKVVYAYPNWYVDVSVPGGYNLEYKFLKKNGSTVTWNPKGNEQLLTPTSSTYTKETDW